MGDKEATLYVGGFSSRCGACGRNAWPYDECHDEVIGYSGNKGPGCGARFTSVASDYIGADMKQRVLEMRPDLKWVGLDL